MMRLVVMSVCGLLACVAAGFPLNPSFEPEAVDEYRTKADAGEAEAQCLYSEALAFGKGVVRDASQSFAYAKKAADQGYERAFLHLGIDYENGWGVKRDADKAVACYVRYLSWATNAAEKGEADVPFDLGRMYECGWGVRPDAAVAFRWMRMAAERGHERAQCALGTKYEHGRGVTRSYPEALRWYRMAAERGNAEAQCYLGWLYEKGRGVRKNAEESLKWIRMSAEGGFVGAQWSLGMKYENGECVERNPAEAVKWYLKAAERGDAIAQYCLGWMYVSGKGVGRDYLEAFRWWRESAEGGDADAQYLLAALYEQGYFGVEKDLAEFARWCRKAAENGHADAQRAMAWMCYFGEGVEKDEQEAIDWYLEAAAQGGAAARDDLRQLFLYSKGFGDAEISAVRWRCVSPRLRYALIPKLQSHWEAFCGKDEGIDEEREKVAASCLAAAGRGDAAAQNALGWMAYFGQGVKRDLPASARWHRKAAEQGDPDAQYALGRMHYLGEGVERDDAEAEHWLRKAAEQGNAEAQNALGWMCYFGRGVGRDKAESAGWYRKAAERGDAEAQKSLGWMLYFGEGVRRDEAEAFEWFRLAAEGGDADAQNTLAWIFKVSRHDTGIDWEILVVSLLSLLLFGSGLWRVIGLMRSFKRTKARQGAVAAALVLSLLGVLAPEAASCGDQAENPDADRLGDSHIGRMCEDVASTYRQLAQGRLSANKKAIVFPARKTMDVMALADAIRDVSDKADVVISTDHMASHAQTLRTCFDTNGQQVEWRTVLSEILNPFDYDFVEAGGVVFVAKRATIARWDSPPAVSAEKVLTVEQFRNADVFGCRHQKGSMRNVFYVLALSLGGCGMVLWAVVLSCRLVQLVRQTWRGMAAEDSGRPEIRQRPSNPICRKCGRPLSLRELRRTGGRCPACGADVPVTDYCAYCPEMDWWRLYSAAPFSVKVATAICTTIVAFGGLLVVLRTSDLDFWWFAILIVAGWWILRQVVIGRVWLHVMFLVLAIVPACIWCMAFVCDSDFPVIWPLGALAAGGLVILPFVLPATRRWGRLCRDDRRAFAVACRCDISVARALPLQRHFLRVFPIVAFVLVVSGLGVLPPILLSDDSDDQPGSSSEAFSRRSAKVCGSCRIGREDGPGNAAANARSLRVEGQVVPPSAEEAKTLGDAVSNVLAQVGKRSAAVGTNGIETLIMPYRQLGDGRSYEIEWRKALYHLLSPVGFDFFEDGELVCLGYAKEVARRHRTLAQERLAANRTQIRIDAGAAGNGANLGNVIRDVASKANVIVTTEYMEQDDLVAPFGERHPLSGEITEKRQGAKRAPADANDRGVEWRTVLREILEPFGYDFVEVDGIVRIAKWHRLAQWRREGLSR